MLPKLAECDDPAASASTVLEQIVDRFEDAWQRGERPDIETHLPTSLGEQWAALIELVHVDLEYRVKAGESVRIERYVDRFPALAATPRVVAELAVAEFKLRRRSEPSLSPQEYRQRFPQLAQEIEDELNREQSGSAPDERKLADPLTKTLSVLPVKTAEDISPPPPRETATSTVRYRPLSLHAKGALGEVLLARDEELHRDVALKRIQTGRADDPESQRRFLLEAEITGRLEHPGIVPVYGLVHTDDGRPCYAMRFVKGDTLGYAIARFHEADVPGRDAGERSLALRQLLSRFVAACNAVAYAHSRGILHRDLKPDNIMLGKYGETLVVDWGLAKPFVRDGGPRGSAEETLTPSSSNGACGTQLGAAAGTPAYMSPEQAAGRWDIIGPASDIYSLGATLYTLLTGRSAFQGLPAWDALEQVRQGDYPAPRQIKPEAPAALEAICRKAMSIQPKGRYQTALGLAEDVEHWLADEPVSAWYEPWPIRLRRWYRRHRIAMTAVTTTLLSWASATLLLLAAQDRERQARKEAFFQEQQAQAQRAEADYQRNEARRNFYVARLNQAQQAWDDAHAGRMLELLAGLRPTSPREADLRGFEWSYLWRLGHSDLVTFRGHTRDVTAVALSPDGRHAASAGYDRTILVWDVASGQPVFTLEGHTNWLSSVAYSPEGRYLASGGLDRTVKVWDARAGTELRTLVGHAGGVTSVAFSRGGRFLASAGFDRTVRIWDLATGQQILSLSGHRGGVLGVAFSDDGRLLASASEDKTAKLWDASTGQELFTLHGHAGTVTSLAFHRDGQRLATGSSDETVRIWNALRGEEQAVLHGHTGGINGIVFSPDGNHLTSASADGTVRIWNPVTGQALRSYKGHTGVVFKVAFHPDSRRLASASEDRTVKVWDTSRGQEALVLDGQLGNGTNLAFSRDGQRLAAAGSAGMVKVWKVPSGQPVHLPPGIGPGRAQVTITPEGRCLVLVQAKNQPLRLWNGFTGKEVRSLEGSSDGATSVAFSPDGWRLAIGEWDHSVSLWDTTTGVVAAHLPGHADWVTALAFSADGRRLASASLDKSVRVWDATTGRNLFTLLGHGSSVHSLAFTPDGRFLASGSADDTVRLWKMETGQEALAFIGHTGTVRSVVFSPDGRRLASAGDDRSIKLWNAATGQEVFSLKGHAGPISSLAFSPDGHRLASAGAEGTVWIWDASPEGSER